jgi:integrase
MAPRKRSEKRRGFPPNLYERDGYFAWRHPKTRQEYGIGRDKALAFREAVAANMKLAGELPHVSLVERIEGKRGTWHEWIKEFEALLAKRKLADTTRRTYKSLSNRARSLTEDWEAFESVTTKVIATALRNLEDEGKARQAQQFRSFMKDCFRAAIGEGWTKENPALVVRAIDVEVKRARLQFDVFMKVYQAEQTEWARNCYALALVSGQDRESCSNALFRDIKDGAWWNERGKTGARIVLPLELRLERFGKSLGEVVKQCRSSGVLSQYLIHQTKNWGNSPAGSQIWVDTITKHFTATLRSLGIEWGEKEPPTFHEIRSLSERLYADQGNVKTQELLGHKDAKTTAIYHDARGEWVRVSITG